MSIVICAAILAITYLSFSIARDVVHNYHLRGDEAQVRSDIHQLDRDHEQLTAVRDYLKSDEYIENVARRVLGLVRPGETLVVVSGVPSTSATSTAAPAGTPAAAWWKTLFVRPIASPTPSAPVP